MKLHPWVGKGLALGAVGLGLVAGLGMLSGVVKDRVQYREQAVQEVTQSLAGPQSLMGPVLAMACTETWTVTRQYYPGGSTSVYRWSPDGYSNVSRLTNAAPGNNCPVPAFEVMNPGRGEARCVGYVAPSWLTR